MQKDVDAQNIKIQNAERQNVEGQNEERHNVQCSKRRTDKT